MLKRIGPALIIATALLVVSPATAIPPGYKACKGTAYGSFYRQLQVKNTTCDRGRAVMRSRAAYDFDTGGGAKHPFGFYCRRHAVQTPGDPNGGLQYNCAKGAKKVRFFAHP